MVSYGEEGLHAIGANTFAITNTTFISTANNSVAIQELPTCVAPVTSKGNTFQGVRTIINQPNCISDPPTPVDAPEPDTCVLLVTAMLGFGIGFLFPRPPQQAFSRPTV